MTTPTQPTKPVDGKQAVDMAIVQGLPQTYANGFMLGLTNADAFIVLQTFGKPTTVLSMSFTLAKTLSLKLAELVNDWETKTGEKIQTTDVVGKAFDMDRATK